MKKSILILGLAAALLACGGKEQTTTPVTQTKPAQQTAIPALTQSLPPGHPPIDAVRQQAPPAPTAPPSAGRLTGRILETMNAGGYTYMRLGTPDGDVWTAVRETKVKKGATVTVEAQMVVEKFQSNSLHRTFDKLIMGMLAETPSKEAPANPMGTAAQHMTSAANAGDATVEKAEGGRTIAETWAKRNELKGKPVLIRGKVVKFLGGIMGKNWIHLRDGSGSRAEGNDDITVTTEEVAKVGDVVTISGTVRVDKDFGAGYLYPVIVEEAKVQK
ncbi:MAG: nucleotide-binding protein [Thermoanaerobaculia bacterium]